MNRPSSGKLIPLALFAFAAMALVAAALYIATAEDELQNTAAPQAQSASEFKAYETPSIPVADQPEDDEPAAEGIPHWSQIDWERLAIEKDWQVLDPRDEKAATAPPTTELAPGANNRRARRAKGELVVITNFTKAEVTVNGERYRSYSESGTNEGMELVANETHQVVVVFNGNQRTYDVTLRPGERRLLMVELTGMNERQAQPESDRRPTRRAQERRDRAREPEEDDLEEDEGEITVYSRPRGTIFIGGSDTGEGTPGTVDVEPGRHEVQVEYREGDLSETKTVRVRGGSRIKLFFREDD